MPRTLFDKIWDAHVVRDLGGGCALLHIDRHLLHDLAGPPSLAEIARRNLPVRNPELTFAVPDHAVSSAPGRSAQTFELGGRFYDSLKKYTSASGIRFFDLGEKGQGIVHVAGPELRCAGGVGFRRRHIRKHACARHPDGASAQAEGYASAL